MNKVCKCNTAARAVWTLLCTYEDPSELDIEFKLDALWLVSDERGVKLGTTS